MRASRDAQVPTDQKVPESVVEQMDHAHVIMHKSYPEQTVVCQSSVHEWPRGRVRDRRQGKFTTVSMTVSDVTVLQQRTSLCQADHLGREGLRVKTEVK